MLRFNPQTNGIVHDKLRSHTFGTGFGNNHTKATNMKQRFFTLAMVLLGLNATLVHAQKEKYDKILIHIVNEEYEKAVYKAEPYTLKDASKKDPIPYLYLGMAYLEMSKRPEFAEKYPKAFTEAMKNAGKFVKRDVKKEFIGEYGDFFEELRKEAYVQAEITNDQQKWTKSRAIYKGLTDIDADDAGAWLMQAYSLYKARANRDGDICAQSAKDALKKRGTTGMDKGQVAFLKKAIITMSEYLSESGNRAKAKEWIQLGHEHFSSDKEYMVTYNNIAG
jgi:hypothetical protein